MRRLKLPGTWYIELGSKDIRFFEHGSGPCNWNDQKWIPLEQYENPVYETIDSLRIERLEKTVVHIYNIIEKLEDNPVHYTWYTDLKKLIKEIKKDLDK